MLEAGDIGSDWTEQRALEHRGRHCTLRPLQDLEASLRFALLGLDADNGGEFINHHVVAWTGQRPRPILLTRSRPYKKNNNVRVGRAAGRARNEGGIESVARPAQSVPVAPGHGAAEERNRSVPAAWGLNSNRP